MFRYVYSTQEVVHQDQVNASHIPSPANKLAKPIKIPTYATTCIPTLGKTSGVYIIANAVWTTTTSGNVIQNGLLEVMTGDVDNGEFLGRESGHLR